MSHEQDALVCLKTSNADIGLGVNTRALLIARAAVYALLNLADAIRGGEQE